MLTDLLRYDFGYDWPWTRGHAIVFVLFLTIALIGVRRRWPRALSALAALVAAWGAAGALIMHGPLQISRPLTLPTTRFLASGTGHVVDLGAGSGRATIGVLLARPAARVTALDLYEGHHGIPDNTPARLRANATAAGVADRVDVRVGDMRQLPFADATFDAAISTFAMDHVPRRDWPRAVRETARVLRPGGEFLLAIVNLDGWIRVALPMPHGHGYFGRQPTWDPWRAAMRDAGFAMVEEGTAPGLMYLLARTPAGRHNSGFLPSPRSGARAY